MTIKEICKKYGYSQTALAKRFGIPLRTVQGWHGEQRNPPEYVVNMMVELLEMDADRRGTQQSDPMFSTVQSHKGVYVIFSDDWDCVRETKGYIVGTSKDAEKCCEELNRGRGEWEREVEYEEVKRLN